MILHLIDDTVEIFRQNCGWLERDGSCNWNINPIKLVNDQASGYFAIGPWGCDGYWQGAEYIRTPENFEELIPIRNVLRISRPGEWERPDPEPELLTQEEMNLPI
jgi:hypothetical protein